MVLMLADVSDGVSMESLAPIGGGAIAGTALGWVMFRVFPAFLTRIDRMIDDNQKRLDRSIDEAQKRDDERLKMYFQVAKENRDEDARRRHDERNNVQQAFLEFTKAQNGQLSELSASVRDLTETIKAQGIRA